MNLLVPGGGQSQSDEHNQPVSCRWQAMSVLFEQHPAPQIREAVAPYTVISALLESMPESCGDEDVVVDERDIMLTNIDPGFGLTIWRRRQDPLEPPFPPEQNEYDEEDGIQDLESPDADVDLSPMQQQDSGADPAVPLISFPDFYNFRYQDSRRRCRTLAQNQKSPIQKILDRAVPCDYRQNQC